MSENIKQNGTCRYCHGMLPVDMAWFQGLPFCNLGCAQMWDGLPDVERPTWDEYFLAIAEVVATRADCVRRKVGAVIVKDNRIVATGYNGAPAGKPGCQSCPRRLSGVESGSSYDTGPGTCVAIHAEINSLLYADRDHCVGGTIYVTDKPCYNCEKAIIGAGIVRTVYG